ncbi:MAG TPA: aminotransferase class I/II-fold pyridoxal phosphate-dependent enzyme, partial [Candidatus Binataceae bacterium]
MIKFNRKVAALKPSATMAADQRAKEMRAAGIDVISLDAGEPDFDTPERIKEAARKALAAGQTKYTAVSGVPELKQAFASKLKRDSDLAYDPSEVLCSAGAKQAEANVINTIFDEGDEVIIPTPAWVSFAAMVELSGARPKFVVCPEERGFILDPADLKKAIGPRTRGILLNSPSNPTGAVLRVEHLSELAKVLAGTEMWVMSDDVYEHIVYDSPVPHIVKIEPRLRPRAIIFNSLSKTYAMTGWRIGFAAGPKEVIAAAG